MKASLTAKSNPGSTDELARSPILPTTGSPWLAPEKTYSVIVAADATQPSGGDEGQQAGKEERDDGLVSVRGHLRYLHDTCGELD